MLHYIDVISISITGIVIPVKDITFVLFNGNRSIDGEILTRRWHNLYRSFSMASLLQLPDDIVLEIQSHDSHKCMLALIICFSLSFAYRIHTHMVFFLKSKYFQSNCLYCAILHPTVYRTILRYADVRQMLNFRLDFYRIVHYSPILSTELNSFAFITTYSLYLYYS